MATSPTYSLSDLDKLEARELLSKILNLGVSIDLQEAPTGRKNKAPRENDEESCPSVKGFKLMGTFSFGHAFKETDRRTVLRKVDPDLSPRPAQHHTKYTKAMEAFQTWKHLIPDSLRVPKVYGYYTSNDNEPSTYWSKNLEKLPCQYRFPTDYLRIELIRSFPISIKRALVSLFYPPPERPSIAKILGQPNNGACLVRPYLGRRSFEQPPATFSTRDFPLPLLAMEHLQLDTVGLAKAMGTAYAVLQWGAGICGRDVNFTLGISAEWGNQKRS
ncbi:hypothetical protein NM208_g13634 [Fusarium decemcellulare]|uniref:Uncharacterized protein n=1 Tax=Fusarium decemcellulare TaxID=57161 RepID=A0ACC1RKZ3_9HYPO|nr:hypothetical protein NM208_g13634 [Fusarium decemcellulare]